jgi:hypothetical protein
MWLNAYKNRGILKVYLKKQKEGCKDLEKAKKLGDLEAEMLIKEYCK